MIRARLLSALAALPLLAAGGAGAALPPADSALPRAAATLLEPAALGAAPSEPDCAAGAEPCLLAEEDEARLAASLLVERLGAEAAGFAAERARRFEQEKDGALARFWRDIAAFAGELSGR
jgi:hypothetical protein